MLVNVAAPPTLPLASEACQTIKTIQLEKKEKDRCL